MTECNIEVQPGVCKLRTKIKAVTNDEWKVVFEVESDCPSVRKMASSLGPIDPMQNVGVKLSESDIYRKADESIAHTACPVPCAFLKAIEVASDMGLKRDVTIEIK
jgi:hypothetical protein